MNFYMKIVQVITSEMVDKSLGKLYEFSNKVKSVIKCPSLDGCVNLMKGYYPKLIIEGNGIDLHYEECPRKVVSR